MNSPWAGFAVAISVALAAGVLVWLVARQRSIRPWGPRGLWLAPVVALLWSLVFAVLSVRKHDGFRTHAYDLAIYDQVVWNISQGRLFENSIMHFLPHFLGDHFSLALLGLAPLYWVWPDPRALLVIQALALGSASLPVAWYAATRLKSGVAGVLIGLALLLHPGMAYTALFDFHDIVFAPPLIGLALFFLLRDRPRLFLAALLPVLLIKEEMGIVVAAVGAWTFVFSRHRWAGGVAFVAGVVWFALVLLVFIPHFNPDGQYYYLRRYFDTGEPGGSAAVSLDRFIALGLGFLSLEKAAYLLHLAVPFALLSLGGTATLMAAPTLGYHLLSPEFPFDFITKHYSVLVLPFLAFGVAQCVGRVTDRRPQLLLPMAIGVVVASAASYALQGPGPLAMRFDPSRYAPEPRHAIISAAIASIPRDARLLAQTDLAPHVAHRRVLYMFPDAPIWGDVDYVLLDLRGNKYPLTNPEEDYDRAIQQYFLSPDFETTFDQEDVVVLRRRSSPLTPNVPLAVNFGRRVGLDGYSLETPTIQAGHPVSLTLWWSVLLQPSEDYVLFVHVTDDAGRLVAQLDTMPTEDWFPTSMWDTGRRFRVSYAIPTPSMLAPGSYRIVVGLYGVNTQRRVAVVSSPGDTSVTLVDRLTVVP